MTAWHLAWLTALRRRRLFAWNVAVPLLLLTPVALSPAAAPHRVVVYGVFLVFFGAFGSAIPTVRDARGGWLEEMFAAGLGPRRWLLESAAASVLIDTWQLAPAALMLLAATGSINASMHVLAALMAALLMAGILGAAIAATVRSLAEAALASAAVSLGLIHLAGFFRPPRQGWDTLAADWSPYRPLKEALTHGAGGPAPDLGDWLRPALTLASVVALAVLTANRWSRRFRWPANS